MIRAFFEMPENMTREEYTLWLDAFEAVDRNKRAEIALAAMDQHLPQRDVYAWIPTDRFDR